MDIVGILKLLGALISSGAVLYGVLKIGGVFKKSSQYEEVLKKNAILNQSLKESHKIIDVKNQKENQRVKILGGIINRSNSMSTDQANGVLNSYDYRDSKVPKD